MTKAKVFVTQVPHRKDPTTLAFVPVVNISTASEFGELVVMMPPRAAFFATAELVRQLRNHLQNYNYEAGDCIVALGDPAIIAVAFALLGKMHPKFCVLKWDKILGRYVQTHITV